MAKVGAQRAAELTGKSKSTIQRAMNAGKLSYEVLKNGRKAIDVSELERVYGLKSETATHSKSSTVNVEAELQKAKDILEMERLKMRVRTLEEQLHMANEQIEDLKEQRESWQKQAQQVLLTSQHAQKQADDLKAEIKERASRARAAKQKRIDANMARLKSQSQNQNQTQATSQNKNTSFWGRLTGKSNAA